PDGRQIVYEVVTNDGPGRPSSQLWTTEVATGTSRPLFAQPRVARSPHWSPDGRWIAFFGEDEAHLSLMIVHPDGTAATALAPVSSTNHPLPSAAERISWSPAGTEIAYVSATSGPEADANGDPMVITRYLYKPTAGEGLTRFNDNRRLHIFVVNVATRMTRQITTRDYYKQSIAWAQERGNVRLYRVAVSGGTPERVARGASERGEIGSWSVRGTTLAFAMSTESRPSELYLQQPGAEVKRVTSFNDSLLRDRTIAPV